jgi:multiple sugar transport system permease protein
MSRFSNPFSKLSGIEKREARAGLLFSLPWIFSLLVFTIYPILASIYLSFTNYSVIQAPKWIGLANYIDIFVNDTAVQPAVYNSLYYALISVPLGLVLSLVLALILNQRAAGIGFYRTIFYLPSLIPPVAATIVFIVLFEPQSGLINTILRFLGLPAPAWFADPVWSKPGLILMSLSGIGAQTLIFLAGLQDIPQSLLEAASIDGANVWQKFWRITIPLLTNVILFNFVMNTIWSFQVFAQALVIGGTTGTPMESTLMFMVIIYRNAFRYFKMGYASALSVVLFVVILATTLIIFRSARLWVFEDSDE